MKRLITVAALAVLAATSAFGRQQVLQDGGFEQFDPNDPNSLPVDPNGVPLFWSFFSFPNARLSTDFAFEGERSFLCSMRTAAFSGAFQGPTSATQAPSGTNILVRAMGYHPSAAPVTGTATSGIVSGIKLEFKLPEGIEVPPAVEDLAFPKNDPNDLLDDDPNDVWVQKTLVAVVPADVDVVRATLISFDNAPDNGPMYVDDVFLETSSDPGVNLLSNASFEQGSGVPNGLLDWTEFADATSGARFSTFEVPAVSGFAVAKFSGNTVGLTQDVSVVAGETLTFTGWFRQRGDDPYFDLEAQGGLKLEWRAGSRPTPDVDIRPNAQPQSTLNNIITNATPTDTWVPLTIEYFMEPGQAAGLTGTVISGFGPGVVDAYFDAFEMVFTNVFDGSDWDADNDADMVELALLQNVITGNGGGLLFGGLVFDHDDDEDVDTSDALFTFDNNRITGPAN
jgi:hypothetical protein